MVLFLKAYFQWDVCDAFSLARLNKKSNGMRYKQKGCYMTKWFILVSILIGGSAFAQEACFSQRFARNFSEATTRSVVVESRRELFMVDVNHCWDLPRAHRISFSAFGDRVCRNEFLYVYDNFDNRVINRCRIHSITKLED